MTAIVSNHSQANSFVYNDQYFGHALMKPALQCWEIITEPLPSNFGDRLATCIVRAFVSLGFLFSSILFVPGLICKSIDYLISGPIAPSQASTQTAFNTHSPIAPPQVPRQTAFNTHGPIAPPHVPRQTLPTSQPSLVTLVQGDSRLEGEAQKLNALQAFANAPAPSNYFSLPIACRYLIAGRYTYPVTFSWHFLTRYSLMEKLEQEFQTGVNVPRFNQAIQEAVILQEKILFAKILLKTLEQGGNIETVANITPQIFNEIKECLWKAYGSPLNQGLDFGGNILRTNPRDHRTTEAINFAVHLWDSAICDLSSYNFVR